MAFNQVRYDLSSFNIDTGNVRFIAATGVEKVSISIGTNLLAFIDAAGNEQIRKYVDGSAGYFQTAVGTEEIARGVIETESMILLACICAERVNTDVAICNDVYPAVSGAEEVTASLALGQAIQLQSLLEETVDKEASLGQEISLTSSGYEFVNESANLIAVDIKTCYIGSADAVFNLAPGQKLVVDAERYNVLVDDTNAIYLQSGDWIDELNPETVSIAITASAGSSGLTASILYTEMYL